MLEEVLQYAEHYSNELKMEQVAATPNKQGFVWNDCC
jgi:hypothetical protein